MPVLVVDGTGALHLANARARRLLFRGDGLRVDRGTLSAPAAPDTRRLRDAIARVAAATPADEGVEECVSLTGCASAALRLRLRAGEPDGDEPSLRRVWILVEDEDPRLAATLGLLTQLTPRERDVLRHLVAGDGAKEIAWSLGLSAHTVAGYVKALHRRLGVRSRGELLARFIGPAVTATLGADAPKSGFAAAASAEASAEAHSH